MSDVVSLIERQREKLERDIAAARETERRLVELAFAAAQVGDFDHPAIAAVIRGQAGELEEYIELCELIKLVAAAQRHSGR